MDSDNRGGSVASDLGVLHRVLLSVTAALVLVVAVASVFGWELITRVQPTWPRIFPYTVGGMAALVIALVLFARGGSGGVVLGRILTAGVICLGLGVDVAVQLNWIPTADRPSASKSLVTTLPSVATVCVATSILMLSSRRDRWPRIRFWLAAIGGLVPVLGLLSYVYGSASLFHQIGLTGLSMPSSLLGILIVGTALTARPDRPPLAALDERYDDALVRQILPLLVAVLFLPAVIARVVETLVTDPASARAVAGLATIVVLVAIVIVAGGAQSRARRALASERQRLWDAFTNTPAATTMIAPDGRILLANAAMMRLVGSPETGTIGRPFPDLVAEDDRAEVVEALRSLTSGALTTRLEARLVRATGELIWVDIGAAPVRDPGGRITYVVVQCTDLTDRKHLEAVLSEQATRDPLTGLLNRKGLAERLLRRAAASSGASSLVVYADVDGLKEINDNFGHAAGDRLLRELSRRLSRATSDDDIIARVGGDEFVVITSVPSSDPQAKEDFLGVLRKMLDGTTGSGEVLSVSLGAATVQDPHDMADALARADEAMYSEKRRRRPD